MPITRGRVPSGLSNFQRVQVATGKGLKNTQRNELLRQMAKDSMTARRESSVTIDKEISSVIVNDGQGSAENSSTGEQLNADNPLIQTQEVADAVAEWVKDVVTNRTLVSGEYRADPRVDAYDKVRVENKYMKADIILSELEISYNGAYTAKYKGRVIPADAKMLNA